MAFILQSLPSMKTTAIKGAKAAAVKKVVRWMKVQEAAQEKKAAARKSGNAAAAALYFKAEIKASNRRARHEDALCKLERAERNGG